MKVLIDTNVIVDALTTREPWNESAEQIFLMAANNIIDMYITASSATDIYYLIRKSIHNTDTAKQILGQLYSLVGILEVNGADCTDALASPIADYEDAVVEKIAKRTKMDCIVTRNVKDYKAASVKVLMPDQLIELVEKMNS